jgi:hypothetical protein
LPENCLFAAFGPAKALDRESFLLQGLQVLLPDPPSLDSKTLSRLIFPGKLQILSAQLILPLLFPRPGFSNLLRL